jgi:UDPglucose 6-dehydrogenase
MSQWASNIGTLALGRALHYGMSKTMACEFHIYDPNPKAFDNMIGDSVEVEPHLTDLAVCDYVFICVPTPTNFNTYNQDLSILNNVVKELAPEMEGGNKLLIIKSTVAPETTEGYQIKYPKVNFVFNPEFLTEANYLTDFLNQDRIVIGGAAAKSLMALYKVGWPDAQYFLMGTTEAEMVKYGANCFLATKVAYFNEIYA